MYTYKILVVVYIYPIKSYILIYLKFSKNFEFIRIQFYPYKSILYCKTNKSKRNKNL